MMLDGTEDEEKFLAAGIAGLQQNSFYMHRALVTPPLNPNLSLFLLFSIPRSHDHSNFSDSPSKFLIDSDPISIRRRTRTISGML